MKKKIALIWLHTLLRDSRNIVCTYGAWNLEFSTWNHVDCMNLESGALYRGKSSED